MTKKNSHIKDLTRRIICSSVIIAVLIVLLVYRQIPIIQGLLVLAIVSLAAVGVWEYTQLMRAKGLHPPIRLLVFVGILEVLAIYVPPGLGSWRQMAVIILLFSVVTLCVFYFDKIENSIVNIATGFFGVCYVAIPLGLMLRILYLPSKGLLFQDGIWWLVYLISVTKMTDIGAYFIGKFFGKHKLTSKISPNKTLEGAIMGLLTATGVSVFMYYLAQKYQFDGFALTLPRAIWLGALIGILGQVGDLAESLMKRDAKVKDSNQIPGLGGVLDMLDSLLFTAPFTYFFIQGF